MRQILIATPLKGDLPEEYFTAWVGLMARQLQNVKLGYSFISGTAIHSARDELVGYARRLNYDEIVFWDKDIPATGETFARLLSHDVPIVCCAYSKRKKKTAWHFKMIPGEEPNAAGLLKVENCAIGYSKIKISVFEEIERRTPDRAYLMHESEDETPRNLHQFFPHELRGPNTPEARLESIIAILEEAKGPYIHPEGLWAAIRSHHDTPSRMHGEDYSFCRIAREAGFDILLDTQMLMKHTGTCAFPIPTAELESMLQEPWRADELSKTQ